MSTIVSTLPHINVVHDALTDVTKSDAELSSDATASIDTTTKQTIEPTMAEHFYRYKVQMSCGGCSGAVTRVLTRAKESGAGVDSFIVSLENQSVEVRGPIGYDDLTERIAKTGKKILEKEEVIETPVEAPAALEVEAPAQPVAVA